MRLNSFLASATGLSRRAADLAIEAGRVTVDGRPATVGQIVERTTSVTLDGHPISPPGTHRYLMLHKPEGYVSSHAQQGKTPTAYELLPEALRHLRLAGRLDADSTGLLLLSDDGDFIHRHTHPSMGKQKIYELSLSRIFITYDGKRMADGIKLRDGISRVTVISANGKNITVSMEEGRKRQLRRTLGALGYGVTRLHRVQVGEYQLGDLAPGTWQELEPPSE